jgi:hypothetical protein
MNCNHTGESTKERKGRSEHGGEIGLRWRSMSEPEKPFDPKATIQLGAGDVTVVAESEPVGETGSSGKLPPPLPTSGQAQGAEEAPPPRSVGKTLIFGAIVVAMLALAAVGGRFFANFIRPSADAAAGAPNASAASSAGAPAATVNLPAVEIR